jgi:general L-amino acid transport system substrate-binding protein
MWRIGDAWSHGLARPLAALAAALLAWSAAPATADTLAEVRGRGYLLCGVTSNSPPFSMVDEQGERSGFDVDNCKSVSAAVFGEVRIRYVPLTPHTAFTTLLAGGIDLFGGGSTWTFTRDARLGLDFAGVYYYDGQGFLVRRSLGVEYAADLDGATVCVAQGTTNELNLADYFHARGLRFISVTFSSTERGVNAYQSGRCDAYSTDRSVLTLWVTRFSDHQDHVVLPDLISKEPFSPVVRQGDPRWRAIVAWSLNVRVRAEELGVSRANVETMRRQSRHPEVRRLLGAQGRLGEQLGLEPGWAYDVIRLVGNYRDVWTTYFAASGVDRGANALWSDGGLLVGLPFE